MRSVKVLTLMAAAFMTVACASTPQGERAERVVVQASVMHVIETAGRPAEKAQRIVDAVALARTLLTDTTVTVGTLRSALLARVAQRDLPMSEKLLALEVINTLSDEVEKRVGAGMLDANALLSINTVLTWVSDAATLYVPHQANS